MVSIIKNKIKKKEFQVSFEIKWVSLCLFRSVCSSITYLHALSNRIEIRVYVQNEQYEHA